MNTSDCFFLKQEACDKHLRVIISDVKNYPHEVVFVTMTSYDVTKEKCCLIHPGEHPFVKHVTCIAYSKAAKSTTENLDKLIANKQITVFDPVSPELLSRIREGASLSRDIKDEFLEILLSQGVLD